MPNGSDALATQLKAFSQRLNNLGAETRVRCISALVMIGVVVLCFTQGPSWVGALLFVLLLALLSEWGLMCVRGNRRTPTSWALGAFGMGIACVSLHEAFMYVQQYPGLKGLFWIPAAICLIDSGAYVGGKLIQGPRLAPRLSPNKTWSGTAVGYLLGTLWLIYGAPSLSWTSLIFVLTLPLAAILGDLGESAAKRFWGHKDLGQWIPGHGGLWDRLDGFVGAFAWMALWRGLMACPLP